MAERPERPEAAAAEWSSPAQFTAISRIFDAAGIVLYVADLESHEMLFMNAEARRLWGSGVGRRCYDVVNPGQGHCARCTNALLVRDGRPVEQPTVTEVQNSANGRWYQCIDKAIPWTDGRLVRMEVAIDITDRILQEQFREQYLEMVAHDLRTPLSTIAMSASLLHVLLEPAGPSRTTAPVEAIARNARHMAEMVEDLLETTRLESGRPELRKSVFDLADFTRTVTSHLGTDAGRPVTFEASGPACVSADARRLERVLENLVGNAFRYSPAGAPVKLRVEARGAEAIVSVSDSGIGISAANQARLFQRLYRAAPGGKGLGLGLYNCRLIVEHHGGRLWVESALGSGSTFSFALPLVPHAAPGDDTASRLTSESHA